MNSPPTTWLLVGDKLGDNAQARALLNALGWTFEVRSLEWHEPFRFGKPKYRPALDHVDLERSDSLAPPWPDLIVTIGRRPSMAALWVAEQSAGKTKLVLLGRPKRWLERFDVVVAPCQYLLPRRENVIRIDLPLLRVDRRRLNEAADRWRSRLEELEGPLIAVLIGGTTSPFVFDAEVTRDLLRKSRSLLEDGHGTLFFTTSRRTPEVVVDELKRSLPPGARLFPWTPEAEENPYLGLLAHADRFVVTGDSISMLTEVAGLGKPLAVYELPTRIGTAERIRAWTVKKLHAPGSTLVPVGDLLYQLGVMGYSRDLTMIHRRLFERGSAVPLGQDWPRELPPLVDELTEVVKRVRELLGVVDERPGSSSRAVEEVDRGN